MEDQFKKHLALKVDKELYESELRGKAGKGEMRDLTAKVRESMR